MHVAYKYTPVLLELNRELPIERFYAKIVPVIGEWPSGKAPVFGTGIRGFESLLPSHEKTSPFGLVFLYAFGRFDFANTA